MKNYITSSVFFLQCLALGVPSGQTSAAENPVGKIIGITGKIEYLAEGSEPVADAKPGEVQTVALKKWEKVEFHQPVFAKDRFRTSRKSRLKILLIDNSLIALGPNSEMKVESYLYNEKDKLRQGVIGMAHGLSMYIINKTQTNKDSSFKMITPTSNIGARGTHGYVAISPTNTFIANKVGNVLTSNVDPGIPGTVELGPLMGNNVPIDGPPTPAKPLSPKTFQQIQSVVIGLMTPASGSQSSNKDSLVEVQSSEEESEEEGESEAQSEGGTEITGGSGAEGGAESQNASGPEGGAESQESGFTQEFLSESTGGGGQDVYQETNNPFPVDQLESCSS